MEVDDIAEEEVPSELPNVSFKCMKCDREYLYNNNLMKHIRLKHKEDTRDLIGRRNLKCGLCKTDCLSRRDFETHLVSSHGLPLSVEEHEFATLEECMAFKANVELRTNSRFVKKSANSGKNRQTYYCHRGGHHDSTSRGLRPGRSLAGNASVKINSYCPAQVKVVHKDDGSYKVVFCSTHVGHDEGVKRTSFLSADEASKVAEMLGKNVPIETVFNDIKDSLLSEGDRDAISNQRDVLSVTNLYNISSSGVLNPSDTLSLDLWLDDLIALQPCPVLLYKRRQELCSEFPQLRLDDFVLVLMTEFQADLLAKHGKELVAISRYPGANDHAISLVALMVCDRKRNGCPVCFVLTGRVDEDALTVAFALLKKKFPRLKPAVVVTDDDEVLLKAWFAAFGQSNRRLLNLWDVDRRIREKIVQTAASKDEQANVYKLLRGLMLETESAGFQNQARNAVDHLYERRGLRRLGEWFERRYYPRYELWSSAYRKRNDVRRLEKVHRTLEHVFSEGAMAKRLDEAVHCLLWYVREKFFERPRHRANLPAAVCEVRAGHQAGLEIPVGDVLRTSYSWLVGSGRRAGESFSVVQQPACRDACAFACRGCRACVHAYRCTCADSVALYSMCAHIHAVCARLQREGDADGELSSHSACAADGDDGSRADDASVRQVEAVEPEPDPETAPEVCADSLRRDIQQLCSSLQESVSDVQKVASVAALKEVKDLLAKTLSSVNSYRESSVAGQSCVVRLNSTTCIVTSEMTLQTAAPENQMIPDEGENIACWLLYA